MILSPVTDEERCRDRQLPDVVHTAAADHNSVDHAGSFVAQQVRQAGQLTAEAGPTVPACGESHIGRRRVRVVGARCHSDSSPGFDLVVWLRRSLKIRAPVSQSSAIGSAHSSFSHAQARPVIAPDCRAFPPVPEASRHMLTLDILGGIFCKLTVHIVIRLVVVLRHGQEKASRVGRGQRPTVLKRPEALV